MYVDTHPDATDVFFQLHGMYGLIGHCDKNSILFATKIKVQHV